VSVLGAGKSGLAAAELLLSRGARVTLWDQRPAVQLRSRFYAKDDLEWERATSQLT